MKKYLPLTALLFTVGLAVPLSAQTPAPAAPAATPAAAAPAAAQGAPKTDREKLGYALGVDVARTFQQQPIEFDPEQFVHAFREISSGAKPQLAEDQIKEVLDSLSRDLKAKQEAQRAQMQAASKATGEQNRKTGSAFLETNKSKPGVQTLPSGLQYKVVTEGSGAMPKSTDTVSVNYRGTTIDGKEFDASAKHGGPATFPVDGVIKGWTEALQKMKTGAKWQLFIPAELAYADNSPSPDIPPGSVLIFDVELVSIGK